MKLGRCCLEQLETFCGVCADIYLCGGFIEKWKTLDIDLVITGNNNIKKIEKVIFEGTKLGIEKYQVFFVGNFHLAAPHEQNQ